MDVIENSAGAIQSDGVQGAMAADGVREYYSADAWRLVAIDWRQGAAARVDDWGDVNPLELRRRVASELAAGPRDPDTVRLSDIVGRPSNQELRRTWVNAGRDHERDMLLVAKVLDPSSGYVAGAELVQGVSDELDGTDVARCRIDERMKDELVRQTGIAYDVDRGLLVSSWLDVDAFYFEPPTLEVYKASVADLERAMAEFGPDFQVCDLEGSLPLEEAIDGRADALRYLEGLSGNVAYGFEVGELLDGIRERTQGAAGPREAAPREGRDALGPDLDGMDGSCGRAHDGIDPDEAVRGTPSGRQACLAGVSINDKTVADAVPAVAGTRA